MTAYPPAFQYVAIFSVETCKKALKQIKAEKAHPSGRQGGRHEREYEEAVKMRLKELEGK